MTRIKLFLMRHSKSCSNHVREQAAVDTSQAIRDPGLTDIGARNAEAYGPRLQARLRKEGFDCDHALIGASALGRAQETARLVFGRRRRPVTLRNFTENGQIPENTPAESAYAAPDWAGFLEHLSTLVKEGDSVAVVGHGSFLRSLWPRLTGSVRSDRLNNMDGILLDADIGPRGLKVHSFVEIPYRGSFSGGDRCAVRDTRKIAAIQKGGFSASIMGAFAANGMRLLPVAAYMGYKMYSNKRATRKKGRGTRTRTRSRVRPRT